jgi:transmembrane sensor
MTGAQNDIDAAIDWLVRLQGPSVTDGDWAAFDAWLSSSADNAEAYDKVLAFDQEFGLLTRSLERDAFEPARTPPTLTGVIIPFRASRRVALWSAGGALAAAFVAGAVLVPVYGPGAARETVYSTGIGERKTIALEDGTRVDLNAASRITVRFERGERHVTMGDSQAYFDVAKEPKRPFFIDAGDTQVRVVGTAFDVRRRDGEVAVAVQRGLVEVRPTTDRSAAPYHLKPGMGLSHVEGQAGAQVSSVATEEILGWREGRLIYRDRPLSAIAADMNRLFDRPVKLGDARAASMRLSGVLIVDQQDAMIGRLSNLLPVQATTTSEAVVIRAR